MKANNYEHAKQKLNELQPGLGETLNPEVKIGNQGHYQIALVRKVNDVKRERYITTFHVQSFNARQLEKLQKGFPFLGYNTTIVVHDPTKQEGQTTSPEILPGGGELPQGPGPNGMEGEAKNITPGMKAPEKVEEAFDVNTARVAELREFAEENNIELLEDDLKNDIKTKIKAWQDEQTNKV